MSSTGDGPRERARRTTDEVRRALLDAAESVVLRDGYAQARITDIAGEAGVSMSVLYRQFDSKDVLVEHALLRPFFQFAETWRTTAATPVFPEMSDEEMGRTFLTDLCTKLQEHRALLRALISGSLGGGTIELHVRDTLRQLFQELTEIAVKQAEQRGISARVMPMTVRLTVALAFVMSTMGSWFLEDESEAGIEEMVRHMTEMITVGYPAMTRP